MITTTSVSALPSPIALTAPEGDALSVLDALLGLTRPDLARPTVLGTVRPELLAAGAGRIQVAVLRYLVEEGGFRERQVLRNGRRTLGRVWSPELGGGLRLTYTEATSTLWLDAARYLPGMIPQSGRAAPAPESDRKHRRTLRDMVVTTNTASGDWVFFAMAQRSLSGFKLNTDDHLQLTKKLRAASPLACLMELDGEGTELELRARFKPLCAMPTARVIECLEDRIAESFTNALATAWSRYAPADQRTARWNTVARVLNAWLDALNESRRMDLARPLLKLFTNVLKGPFARGGDAARAELSNSGWVRNVRERDDLIASVASVIAIGQDLFRRRDALGTERYGDERYDEAQIYLRDVAELLTPSRRALDGVARALSDTIS